MNPIPRAWSAFAAVGLLAIFLMLLATWLAPLAGSPAPALPSGATQKVIPRARRI